MHLLRLENFKQKFIYPDQHATYVICVRIIILLTWTQSHYTGAVYASGSGVVLGLGRDDGSIVSTPTLIAFPPNTEIVAMSAHSHAMAVTKGESNIGCVLIQLYMLITSISVNLLFHCPAHVRCSFKLYNFALILQLFTSSNILLQAHLIKNHRNTLALFHVRMH